MRLRALGGGVFVVAAVGCGGGVVAASDGGPAVGRDATSGDSGSGGSRDGSASVGDGSIPTCPGTVDAAPQDDGNWGQPPDGGAWSLVCPESQPASASRCSGAALGVQCEYGPAWWSVACNTAMWCEPGTSVWVNNNPSPVGCLPEPGANCTACPADPSSATGTCSIPALDCYYGAGPTCTCSQDGTWTCFPPAGCPSERPRLGAPCASVPAGGCPYECYERMLCTQGLWQLDMNASCP